MNDCGINGDETARNTINRATCSNSPPSFTGMMVIFLVCGLCFGLPGLSKNNPPIRSRSYLGMPTILITGDPGVGKTTCIRKISRALGDRNPAGFLTEEIREEGTRVGFEIAGLDGRRLVLAHLKISSRYRVGKYRVDIAGFESYLCSLIIPGQKNSVLFIDEIGKMECFSTIFRDMITRFLASDCLMIATIAKKGNQFIEEIKKRDDVILVIVTRENREDLPTQVLDIISRVLREQG